MTEKERRRIVVRGVVKSAKMDKTIVVRVDRLVKHPRFKKYIRRSTSYYAHDPENEAREGDVVEIALSRPLSKLKRWRLVKIVKREAVQEAEAEEEAARTAGPEEALT